jgi:multidrug efflux system outer membrane protein
LVDYPLVDSGRGRAGVAIARAQAEQAAVTYRNAILLALREVADTLVTLQKVRERIVQRQAQVTAALAELDLASSRQEELRASVQLYRALGGGWSDDELRRLIEQPGEARKP